VLEVREASLRHAGGPPLFTRLSFSLQGGQSCVLLGPNGTGKTSLMKAILGTQRLDAGAVICDVTPAHVPQSLEPVFDFSVHDIVLMGATARHGQRLISSPRAEDYRCAEEALAQVGLADFARRGFASLSGGERQLTLLARAVATGSRLIILDEPTAALDLGNEERVLCMLETLKDAGVTLLMSSHTPDHALRIADRVLMLHRDGSHHFGSTAECLRDDYLSALYGLELRVRHYRDEEGLHATVARRASARPAL